MANDVQVTEGSGKTVKTVDIGGKQYQVILVGTSDGTLVSAGNALPVLLDAATLAALEHVSVDNLPASLGSKTAANSLSTTIASDDAAIGAPTDAAATGNGSLIAIAKQLRALLSGTLGVSGNVEIANDVGNPIPVSGTFWQTTQPVAGQAAGGATAAGNPVPVGGTYNSALPTYTNGQRAEAQFDSNGRLIIAATNNDPATGAKQDTGNTSLGTIATRTPALGQATMANSSPVVLASNQSAVAVDSELPAAALLADAAAVPTTPTVGAANLLYNGATYGLQRSTARYAAMMASDWRQLVFNSTTPNPSGNDITMTSVGGSVPAATDFQIRDTSAHIFVIPLAVSGWKDISIWLRITSAFDQAIRISPGRRSQASIMMSSWSNRLQIASGSSITVEFSSLVGNAAPAYDTSISVPNIYAQPIMATAPQIALIVDATVAPTAGNYELVIERRS